MSGPWEDFQKQPIAPVPAAEGPWADFQKSAATPAPASRGGLPGMWDTIKSEYESGGANFKRGLQAIAQDPTQALNVGPGKMAQDAAASIASGVTLPGDVVAGREDMPLPRDMTPEQAKRVMDLANVTTMVGGGGGLMQNPAVRAGSPAIPAAERVVIPGKAGPPVAEMAAPAAGNELPNAAAPIIDMKLRQPPVEPPTVLDVPSVRTARPEPPTGEALRKTASKQFDAVADMGVQYQPGAVNKMAANLKLDLEKDAIFASDAPKVHSLLDNLAAAPTGKNPLGELNLLISARKSLRRTAQDFKDKTSQAAASRAIGEIDSFIQDVGPSVAVAGPAAEAAALHQTARGNFAAGMRSKELTRLEEKATTRAGATYSGQNLGNTIRQRVASLLESPQRVAGFSPEEIAALEYVAKGGQIANVSRTIGNMLGGGGGAGATLTGSLAAAATAAKTGSFSAAALAGGVAPWAGRLARNASNAMTRNALRDAERLVRTRAPLHDLNASVPVAAGGLEQLPSRSLMLLGQQATPMTLNVGPSGWEE